MSNKSREAFSYTRLLLAKTLKTPRKLSQSPHFPTNPSKTHYSTSNSASWVTSRIPKIPHFPSFNFVSKARYFAGADKYEADPEESIADDGENLPQEIMAEAKRQWNREREERIRAGLDTVDLDKEEEEEDYMGVGKLIEKLEKDELKDDEGDEGAEFDMGDDMSSDSDSEGDDDERFSQEALDKKCDLFDRKFDRHSELLKNFTSAGNLFVVILYLISGVLVKLNCLVCVVVAGKCGRNRQLEWLVRIVTVFGELCYEINA